MHFTNWKTLVDVLSCLPSFTVDERMYNKEQKKKN